MTRSANLAGARFVGAIWLRDDRDMPPPMTLALIRSALPSHSG